METRNPNARQMRSRRVSVIMPSYNHIRFVEQAIRSVWEQSYEDTELIVIDDGSTDGTALKVKQLADQSPIEMQVVLKESNKGVSHSLNLGLSMATGGLIAFLSSDDFYSSDKIARQIAVMAELGKEYGCLHTDGHLVSESGAIVGRRYESKRSKPPLQGSCFDALVHNSAYLIPTSSLIRRELVDLAGGFDESFVAEDYDFYLRLARITSFYYLAEPLIFVRVSHSSLGRQPWRYVDSIFAALDKHVSVSGYDWPRIKALRWLTVLPGFLEHGTWRHIRSAIGKSFRTAREQQVLWPYFRSLLHIGTVAAAYRFKRFAKSSVKWGGK